MPLGKGLLVCEQREWLEDKETEVQLQDEEQNKLSIELAKIDTLKATIQQHISNNTLAANRENLIQEVNICRDTAKAIREDYNSNFPSLVLDCETLI